jgi:hypothetical protein
MTLFCSDPAGSEDPSEIPHRLHVTVVDPDGLYVPADLTGCLEGRQFSFFADFAPDAEGEPASPEDIVRALFSAEPDDLVERAGYPEEAWVRMRIVHDGKTVVVATLWPGDGGGWFVDSARGCAGFEQGSVRTG